MDLKFWPLEVSPKLMAMPDAAFRNNSDKSSQRAMVVFMSKPRKEKSRNSRGSLIFFESTRIKRTTLSTTVAELYALMKMPWHMSNVERFDKGNNRSFM